MKCSAVLQPHIFEVFKKLMFYFCPCLLANNFLKQRLHSLYPSHTHTAENSLLTDRFPNYGCQRTCPRPIAFAPFSHHQHKADKQCVRLYFTSIALLKSTLPSNRCYFLL